MSKILIYSQEDLDLILELEKQENEELQQENKQLKIQISAREEVCNRLESNWNKLNKKYENAVADYETTMFEKEQLKKQLEEWKQHLKYSKEILDMQGQKGNYDYDEYMLGLYNGMEYIISLFETREPNYINGKDIKFINNKTQQKEFIEYMTKTIEELECDDEDDEEMKGYLIQRIDTFKEILQKYKTIIGSDK